MDATQEEIEANSGKLEVLQEKTWISEEDMKAGHKEVMAEKRIW
jgi:hypothetical protein